MNEQKGGDAFERELREFLARKPKSDKCACGGTPETGHMVGCDKMDKPQ